MTTLGVLVAQVAGAAPAAAHAVSGIDASNFESVIRSVEPDVAGVQVRVVELGSRLELRNRGDDEVLVLGYDEEPYLRVGREGVFENVRSPATYLNASRTGTSSIPSTADASAPPSWRRVSAEPVARWHDHRIHWMGDRLPPAVRRDPGRRHVVNDAWAVPLRAGATEVTVSGQLLWVPGPSPLPWAALAVVLFVITVLACAALGWGGAAFRRLCAAAVVLVLAVDVVHAFGTAWIVEASTATRVARAVASSPAVLVGWVAAVAALVLLAKRGGEREAEGVLAGAFAGVVVAVFGGLVDRAALSRSHMPFAGPATLARLCVAVSLGLGTGMAVVAVLALRGRREPAGDGEPVASIA